MSSLDDSGSNVTPQDAGPLLGLRAPAKVLVGLAGCIAVVASVAVAPGAEGILGAALAVLMAAIAFTDARHFVVPNTLTAAALALAVVNAAVSDPPVFDSMASSLMRAAATALVFLALRSAYAALRDRQGIGLGDVKLAGVAGAWVGWSTIPMVIEIAALAAIGGYLFRQLSLGRPVRAAGRIPFGLYLAPAIWLGWLLEATVLG